MARMKWLFALVPVMVILFAYRHAPAQEPVTGASDPEALFTSSDPALNANKQVVLHIVRDLLIAGHWKDAPNYLTERYIQHNPNVVSGREAVMKFFGGMPERPIPDKNRDRVQKSVLCPWEKARDVSGAYANHPTSGALPAPYKPPPPTKLK